MVHRVSVKSFGGPEVLQLEEFDLAQLVAQPDKFLVHVHAFGINPVETYVRNGLYDPLPSLPYTPGTDGAGMVGNERVWLSGSVSGTYAEYCLCNASDVHKLPDSLSFEQGAAIGIAYRTAFRALIQFGAAKRGEGLLIHGASGGVGIAAIQMAKLLGMHPIIASRSGKEDEWLLAQGATMVVDHGACPVLVDVILENLANANLSIDLKLIKKRGRIVVVGNRGEVTINPRDLMRAEGTITGFVGAGSPADKTVADEFIQAGLESGALCPLVGPTFAFSETAKAHDEVMSHSRGTRGKVVVTV